MSDIRPSGRVRVRRSLRTVTLALVALASGFLTPIGVAHAVDAGPTTHAAVTSAGGPAADVAVGASLVASTSTLAETSGSVQQTLSTAWDPTQATAAGDVTAPEGWSLEYNVDGTWTNTAPTSPSDLAALEGVRANGTTTSAGALGGKQLSISSGSGELKAGGGSFQGSSGGDGWDVFFAGSKVLNVFHHNASAYSLDCHQRTDGSSCNASVYTKSGFITSGASTGAVVGSKVYSLVGHTTDAGVLCTDVSTSPFTDCGYTALISGSFANYGYLGRQTQAGSRIYAPVVNGSNGALLCYDTATSAACTGQPFTMTGMASIGSVPTFASTIAGRVFVTANKVWCFTASTGAACSGSWPVGSLNGSASVTPKRDANLAVVGVCTVRPVGSCWDFTGASLAYPTGLSNMLTSHAANSMGTWSDWSSTSRRLYWVSSNGSAYCYDWKTDAACAGFTSPSVGGLTYATVIDPSDPACVWSNSDNGQIKTFDGLTGSLGCPPPTDPTLQVSYTTAAPRLSCSEDDRVSAWNSITLHTAGAITMSDLRLTVKDSVGDVVTGWSDITPPNSGVIDLSTLAVADTGSQPTFEVKAVGASSSDAQGLTVDVAYTSNPAQLCVSLTVLKDCPELTPGVQNTAGVPVAAMTVTGTATADSGSGPATTTVPVEVTRADQTGCIGAVSGTVVISPPGGDRPAAGVPVTIAPTGGAVIATVTTDADGDYAFPHVRPGAYTVTALGVDGTTTVTTTTQDVDLAVPVTAPDAGPVSVTTLQGTAAAVPVAVTTDDQTEPDLTSVVLRDPSDNSWVTTLVVADEGTWKVLANGSLEFTPLDTFTGTSSNVTYRVADGFGSTDTSTAHAVVTAVRPTAHPVRSTGVQGSTQTVEPDGRSQTLTIDPASVRIVDPATGLPETSVTIADVGTFTADTVNGRIVLVPVGGFVGSATVIYQVSDSVGQIATSTITVTTTPLDATPTAVTVDPGDVASVPVGDVPDDGTVAGAASIAGKASAVTYGRTAITVTPVAGFSGLIQVPFTVTNGTATIQRTARVTVRPLAATAVGYKVGYRSTVIGWARSKSSGVTGYEVWVNGKKVCSTTATSCTVAGVLGPKAKVSVVTVGGDGVRTQAGAAGKYLSSGACGGVSAVYFDNASAVITSATRTTLASTAATINAQGFTKVCLVGFTDANGSVAYNLALSKRRVNAVGAFLTPRLAKGVKVTKDYNGEADPAAPNDTSSGRAANRRVEIRVG